MIPMFDYRPEYQRIQGEILEAVAAVLASGRLILGPRVEAFEEHFGWFLRAEGTCVGVGSGTDALAIALRALEIGPGDEVITVANTAVATVAAIRMVGATPVFGDIDPETLLMDPRDVETRVTPRTKAILPVHLFGNGVDMPAVLEVARRHGLRVVEDCAQSCGTTLDGRATGTWGDVGCFSFYPTKNLGAYGDGGLCFTADPVLAEAIRKIRTYGWNDDRIVTREGVNSRLDEIQAAILDVKLRRLAANIDERRRLAAAYAERLPSTVRMQRATPGARHSYHLVVVEVDDRPSVIARLTARQIGYGVHYSVPIPRMPAYAFLKTPSGGLPRTDSAAGRVLSLPCYPGLPHEAVAEVCEALAADA